MLDYILKANSHVVFTHNTYVYCGQTLMKINHKRTKRVNSMRKRRRKSGENKMKLTVLIYRASNPSKNS